MSEGKKKQIRNSTAEFLTFTAQSGEQSIESRYEDGTVWLTQKLIATLFDVSVKTISEHFQNIFATAELDELHVAWLVRFCVLPSLYIPVATNCCVLPAGILADVGVTMIFVSIAAAPVA